jgi:NaMN:DMB phosphoribosyltransferase
MWSECRLVGLGVVGVVMGFRVNRILVTRIGTVCVVCVMMAIRVIDMFDRVLFSSQVVSLGSYTAHFALIS